MPLKDSAQSEKTEQDRSLPASADAEDIETPIESGVQEQAEHEFETQRKTPPSVKKAIVSVNGEDVDEVPLENPPAHPWPDNHDRAA